MKFKSTMDVDIITYRNDGSGMFDTRAVDAYKVIDVDFDDIVESHFHTDVMNGIFIAFDQAAIDWTCNHVERTC